MTKEDEKDITARFAAALNGRFGILKPAQAIARTAAFIAELREELVSWRDIERLFNNALSASGRTPLRPGSVTRIYHIVTRRAAARAAAPYHPVAAAAAVRPRSSAAAAPAIPTEPVVSQRAGAPGRADAADAMGANLRRIEARRADNRRLNET